MVVSVISSIWLVLGKRTSNRREFANRSVHTVCFTVTVVLKCTQYIKPPISIQHGFMLGAKPEENNYKRKNNCAALVWSMHETASS